MELKALILGITFSLGIFGLKNGLGLWYMLSRLSSLGSKGIALGLYAGVYAGVFAMAWWGVHQLILIDHFQALHHVLCSGMAVHLFLAGLLGIWGRALLKNAGAGRHGSWGWLALVLPCPVCGIVIFFTVSFLLSFFPEGGGQVLVLVWAGFVGTGVVAALLFNLLAVRMHSPPELLLGGGMLGVACFFLLAVTFMPQFGQMDEVYRLASYDAQAPAVRTGHALFLVFAVTALFGVGFWVGRKKT
ncbi:MAG: DUF2162 family putative transporter [Desulfovermiculus sp.]